jgi:hypothetical protein
VRVAVNVSFEKVLIALPLGHLLVSSIYLWAYCIGFGGNIASFMAPSDIFSTSIGNIASIYIATIFYSALMLLAGRMGAANSKKAAEAILRSGDPSQTDIALERFLSQRKSAFQVLVVFLICVEIFLISVGIRYYSLTGVVLAPTILGPVGGVAFLIVVRTEIFVRYPKEFLSIALMGFIAVSAFAFGIEAGQTDRDAPVLMVSKEVPSCKGFAVLRKVSDKLLLVRYDGMRVLSDEKCEAQLVFRKRYIIHPAGLMGNSSKASG